MQALLLDTHVWLWLVTEDRRKLAEPVWARLEQHGARNGLAVSDVSFWEIALKTRKRHLTVKPDTRAWLKHAGKTPGVGIIQLDREILIRSTELDMPERDPADRMLVATALRYDLRLATADATLLEYARQNRELAVLDCRV